MPEEKFVIEVQDKQGGFTSPYFSPDWAKQMGLRGGVKPSVPGLAGDPSGSLNISAAEMRRMSGSLTEAQKHLLELTRQQKKEESERKEYNKNVLGIEEKGEKSGGEMLGVIKGLAGAIGIGFLIKQSKIMSGLVSTLLQIIGGVVDTILAPFMPLLAPILATLTPLLIALAKLATTIVGPLLDSLMPGIETIAKWLTTISGFIERLLPNIVKPPPMVPITTPEGQTIAVTPGGVVTSPKMAGKYDIFGAFGGVGVPWPQMETARQMAGLSPLQRPTIPPLFAADHPFLSRIEALINGIIKTFKQDTKIDISVTGDSKEYSIRGSGVFQ